MQVARLRAPVLGLRRCAVGAVGARLASLLLGALCAAGISAAAGFSTDILKKGKKTMIREKSFSRIPGESSTETDENGNVVDNFRISKEDQAIIEKLEAKYGYVRFVENESKSLIASAEKKSLEGTEESDQSSEKRIDSLVKRASQLPENKGIAFLSDEYNRLQIKMKEVQTAFCRVFDKKELTPREIAQASSEKFYIFVNGEYKQARRRYIETTSHKYQAIPVAGRFSGPRFTNASERLARTINWSDNAVKSKKEKKVITREKKEKINPKSLFKTLYIQELLKRIPRDEEFHSEIELKLVQFQNDFDKLSQLVKEVENKLFKK